MTTASGGYMLSGFIPAANKKENAGTPRKADSTFSRRRYMIRTLFFVLTFLLAFIFGAIFSSYAATEPISGKASAEPEVVYTVHIVEKGETLWSIARLYAPEHTDIRQFIHEIRHASGLSSGMLTEGRILQVPLSKSP